MSDTVQELGLLIIDDDAVDRQAVRRALAQARLQVRIVEADTAQDGIAAARASDVHVVLLDYQLPGATGLEVLAELRRARPLLPVIVLTGFGDEQLAATMMKAGAADYLSKHALSSDRLKRSIRHALALAAGEAERHALLASEQRAREEAQAANRAKDEFLAALSHELRTPLNAILGWARLVSRGTLDAPALQRAIATIERNALLQAKLIEDLLDVSRIVTGKLTLDTAPVDVGTIVAAAIDSARPSAEASDIVLRFSQSGRSRLVMGDQARLQQVVTNVLSNALKFTPERGSVDVELKTSDTAVEVSVADTGQGIDSALLPHIFERFKQGHASLTRGRSGLGLGLSIVKHLVDQHGGSVTASSPGPGQGTRVMITLPVTSQPLPDGAPEDVLPSLEGVHVLVVDDDTDGRAAVVTMLRQRGARVVHAGSAGEALMEAMLRPPHILLSDIAMPGQDGYSLLQQLRSAEAGGDFPAVAITAFAGPDDRARSLQAGFQAHVAKPIDADALIKTIARLLAGTKTTTPAGA